MLPIHNHSDFSALDGFSKPAEIAERVEALGMGGAFLTDHGNVAGWRAFSEAMRERGLFAGFGMEAYQAEVHRTVKPGGNVRDQAHLILLAQNSTGVRNISLLSDESNRSGYYYVPRIDWELMEQHSEGVICTSACMGGLLAQSIIKGGDRKVLNTYQKIFGDRFYIEIHTYATEEQQRVNRELVSIARERGIPMVYANDAHYTVPEDYLFHELMISMQYHKVIDFDNLHHPDCLYIMGEGEVRSSLSYLGEDVVDECIANSDLIAGLCEGAALPEARRHLPRFVPREPTGESNEELLVRKVREGCRSRYGSLPGDVADRAVHELETIIGADLSDYFLITADLCDWSDSERIQRGPGRGSVGGSIIAYALGITDVDPIKYGLYFERFYNAGRTKGLPDIDIDFSVKQRHRIDEYLIERYGEYNVASIGTTIRLKPKSTIDKVAAALGIRNFKDVNAIKAIIDSIPRINILSADQIGWHMDDGENIVVAIWDDEDAAEALAPYRVQYEDLFDCAERIGGRISTYGVHASAVVVSDCDMREILPVAARSEDKKGKRVLVTQADMHEVEALGFMKNDRLGLRNLDTLETLSGLVGGIDYNAIDWESLPEGFWRLIDDGLTLGLFQIEGGIAARSIGRRLKPRSILELAAIVALNRPGPLRSGVADRFIERRHGRERASYAHPILEPILQETYGDFVYQEHVIAYANAIGYSLSEADEIRKMLGKKLPAEMKREYTRYIDYAQRYMERKTADEIWDSIIRFSEYSFNKAHAVCYAILLARTMYAKWKHPIEFIMAAVQTNPDDAGLYIAEARRMGFAFKAPDVNVSGVRTIRHGDDVYLGLSEIKGVGVDAAKWIIAHRPEGGYKSYEHLIEIRDTLGDAWKKADKADRAARSPGQQCTSGMIEKIRAVGGFPDDDFYSEREVVANQELLLGICVIDTFTPVIESNADEFEGMTLLKDVEAMDEGEDVEFPAVVVDAVEKTSKRGNQYGRVTLAWGREETEMVVFPDLWRAYRFLFERQAVCVWRAEKTDGGVKFKNGRRVYEKADRLAR